MSDSNSTASSSSKPNKDKTFYLAAGNPTHDSIATPPTPHTESRIVNPVRPSTADTTATRPPSSNSFLLNDPFATPVSSRPPSVRHFHQPQPQPSSPNASKVAFTDSVLTGLRSKHSHQPSVFSTARASFRLSTATSASAGGASTQALDGNAAQKPKAGRMRSHMLSDSNPVEKHWIKSKSTRARVSYWIVYFIFFLGVAGGAFQCYWTFINVPLDKLPLCMVLDENFDNETAVFGPGGTFTRDVNMNGNGNGEFEMTTASENNSFIQNGMLYIVPTLTSDNIGMAAVLDGAVYNISGCTFNSTASNYGYLSNGQFDEASYVAACSAVSNSTSGTVINPVQSARLSTVNSASIRYGRVEIRAKMPTGDWLWPALWMLPTQSVYGPWPISGEIDIVESRGNGIQYTGRGSNYVQGSLNWGPTTYLDGVSKTYSWWTEKRTSFSSGFHTYALEWTEQFLRVYVDTRLHTLLDLSFNQPFFQRGDFPEVVSNGSGLIPLPNPWINGTYSTPFDQEFYFIMNVAVGSTNGWFPDGQGNKPWLNNAPNPARDFITNMNQWYPTWPSSVEDRAMVIDYVKMWKHCGT